MSFFSRLKGSKKDGVEDSRQSPARSRAPITVAVPPKPSTPASPRSTSLEAGQSLFAGMNFGEGASATSEPDTGSAAITSGGSSQVVAQDRDCVTVAPADSSGFAFITEGASDGASVQIAPGADAVEEQQSSGFSFISSENAPEIGADAVEEQQSSGFSFISSENAPEIAGEPSAEETEVSAPDVPAVSQEEIGEASTYEPLPLDSSANVTIGAGVASIEQVHTPSKSEKASPKTPIKPSDAPPVASGSGSLTPASAGSSSARKKKKTRLVRPGHARQEVEPTAEPLKKSPPLAVKNDGSKENAAELNTDESLPCVGRDISAKDTTADSAGPSEVSSQAMETSSEPASVAPVELKADTSSSLADGANEETGSALPDEDPAIEADATVKGATQEHAVDRATDGEASFSQPAAAAAATISLVDVTTDQVQQEGVHEPVSQEAEEVMSDNGKSMRADTADAPVSSLSNSTPGDGISSVYDIKLNVDEQFDLRMQSESSQLKDVQSNLRSVENEILAVFSCQLATQQKRLKRRCAADELRKQEADAIAKENYEEAGLCSAELKSIEDGLSVGTVLSPPVAEIAEWNLKRDALIQSQCVVRRESITIVQSLLDQRQQEADDAQKQSADSLTKQRQEISDQRDALERQQSHLEVDWGHCRKSDEKLRAEEEEKTSVFRDRRQILSGSLEEVQGEIYELEERLRKLRDQSHALEEDIRKEDEKIEDVRREMAEQRSRLTEQQETLQAQQDTLDIQKADVAKAEEVVERTVQELKLQQERFKEAEAKMNTVISSNTLALDTSSGDIDAVKMFLQEYQRPEINSSPSVSRLKDSWTAKQKEADSIMQQIVASQREVGSLRKRLGDADNQLPDLEDAKKLAVSGKNFREAQRIKQEKERLLAEKATVTSLLDEERQNTVQYNEQLTKLQGHLDELRAEYLQAEEECDMDAVSRFTVYTEQLESLLASNGPSSPFLSRLVKTECLFCRAFCAELSLKHGKSMDISDLADAVIAEDDAIDIDRPSSAERLASSVAKTSSDEDLVKSIRDQIDNLEVALDRAIEEEDYVRADDINSELTALRSRLAPLA